MEMFMRCRAHGGMKIRELDTRTSRDRQGVDTIECTTRLFSRENAECLLPRQVCDGCLSSAVYRLRSFFERWGGKKTGRQCASPSALIKSEERIMWSDHC
jgi:hypothetical protein